MFLDMDGLVTFRVLRNLVMGDSLDHVDPNYDIYTFDFKPDAGPTWVPLQPTHAEISKHPEYHTIKSEDINVLNKMFKMPPFYLAVKDDDGTQIKAHIDKYFTNITYEYDTPNDIIFKGRFKGNFDE